MADFEFWSTDRKYGLRIPEKEIAHILELCAQSKPYETGGILIGCYTTAHDCALVTAVSRAPSDSKRGRTHFVRGVRGLQRWIDYLWRRKHSYYLGEWHFHPGGLSHPSRTDAVQMRSIAEAADYQCPEPILVIIGGCPPERWAMKAYVFPKESDGIELLRSDNAIVSRAERESGDSV